VSDALLPCTLLSLADGGLSSYANSVLPSLVVAFVPHEHIQHAFAETMTISINVSEIEVSDLGHLIELVNCSCKR